MPKYLIVYYSRTGHTEKLAQALAGKLNGDIERVEDSSDRQGSWAYFRSVFESLSGALPQVARPKVDLAAYDVVILGCPVWVSRPATPMRAFLAANAASLKTIACFCTYGGSGADKMLAQLEQAAGKPALAKLSLTEAQLSGNWQAAADTFVHNLTRTSASESA